MIEEEKTARAGQGDDAEKRAESSNSVNTERARPHAREKTPPEREGRAEVKAPQEGAPRHDPRKAL